jgi:hypothetical protein
VDKDKRKKEASIRSRKLVLLVVHTKLTGNSREFYRRQSPKQSDLLRKVRRLARSDILLAVMLLPLALSLPDEFLRMRSLSYFKFSLANPAKFVKGQD